MIANAHAVLTLPRCAVTDRTVNKHLDAKPMRFRDSLDAHHGRVATMARRLAKRMGLERSLARAIGEAAARHDIGKLLLNQTVFELPRRLTPQEEAHVRTHTMLGYAALGQSDDPVQALAARVALEHHEHWDGGGYPFGLRGEAISLEARIVAICDVYDALREARSYKPGYSHRAAMAVITQGDARTRPSMFDPAVLAVVNRDGGRFLDRVVRNERRMAIAA